MELEEAFQLPLEFRPDDHLAELEAEASRQAEHAAKGEVKTVEEQVDAVEHEMHGYANELVKCNEVRHPARPFASRMSALWAGRRGARRMLPGALTTPAPHARSNRSGLGPSQRQSRERRVVHRVSLVLHARPPHVCAGRRSP